MIEFLKKVFTDESGNPSSPRVLGAILIVAGIVAAFVVEVARAIALLSAGTGLITAGQIKSAIVGSAQAAATAPLPPAQPAQPSAVNVTANEQPPPGVPAPTKPA